jgi:hypothetical protein
VKLAVPEEQPPIKTLQMLAALIPGHFGNVALSCVNKKNGEFCFWKL